MKHVLGVGKEQVTVALPFTDENIRNGPTVQPFDDEMQRTILEELAAACNLSQTFERILYVLKRPPSVKTAEEILVTVERQHHGVVPGTEFKCDSLGTEGAVME